VNIPHYNIIGATRQPIQQSQLQWTCKYIPGHQTVFPLDREAAMNDDMDQRCKRYWECSCETVPLWFENTWSVWIRGERIVSDLTRTIREICSIARAETYWRGKIQDKRQIRVRGLGMYGCCDEKYQETPTTVANQTC
jgi:hypothetical protein